MYNKLLSISIPASALCFFSLSKDLFSIYFFAHVCFWRCTGFGSRYIFSSTISSISPDIFHISRIEKSLLFIRVKCLCGIPMIIFPIICITMRQAPVRRTLSALHYRITMYMSIQIVIARVAFRTSTITTHAWIFNIYLSTKNIFV